MMHIERKTCFCSSTIFFILALLFTGILFLNFADALEEEKNKSTKIDLKDIVFVVLTQQNSYHQERAKAFKKDFYIQLKNITKDEKPKLFFTHKKWPMRGYWTIFPLFSGLVENFSDKSWVFICEEEARLKLWLFLEVLRKYDPTKPMFIGNALRDETAVIIHHFAFAENPSEFSYPNFALGFCMSLTLVKSLHERWPPDNMRTDFSIDPKHEFAMYIWDDGNGVSLEDVPEICKGDNCVTKLSAKFPECGKAISSDDLFVAVKTCSKFHEERIPVVKKTWAREAKHIEYYSDVEDPTIPTIDLGVPNTERGHCKKTFSIMVRILREPSLSSKSWFLIADDDTIISITRLRKLLSCYNTNEPVALGERYGYGVSTSTGYDYITGGGGMVFNRAAIEAIVTSGQCSCPRIDSPDDMILGMCLQNLHIPITHSPLFHQARPNDYSKDLLALQDPISFHKHWMIDPLDVYQMWFAKAAQFHDEL